MQMWSQVRSKEHSSTSVWPQGDRVWEEAQGVVDGTACPSLSRSTDTCARQSWGPRLSARTADTQQTSDFVSLPNFPFCLH